VEAYADHDLDTYGFGKFLQECALISTAELNEHTKMSRYFWL
jgi:hypothetical protein